MKDKYITKETFYGILFLFFLVITIGFSIYYINQGKLIHKQVDCFDENHNKILGLTCDEEYKSFNCNWLFILIPCGLLIFIFEALFLNERYKDGIKFI